MLKRYKLINASRMDFLRKTTLGLYYVFLSLFLVSNLAVATNLRNEPFSSPCKIALRIIGSLSPRLKNFRLLERYWNDHAAILVADAITSRTYLDTHRDPFRIDMKTEDDGRILSIRVNTLAVRQNVYSLWFLGYITLLSRDPKSPDSTMARFLTGVVRGIYQSKINHPNLKTVRIIAPSLISKTLIAKLAKFGFTPSSETVEGQIVIGKSSSLELTFDLNE